MVGTISDSNAFREDSRMLPQHQAALTLLQGLLANPVVMAFEWLDLACGRGQIICRLKDNLSDQARAKLRYLGYDVRDEYTKETLRTASGLGLNFQSVKTGELSDFCNLVGAAKQFDFITLTNTIHEVSTGHLATLLVDCATHLTDEGCLFVYDMETINPFELGAVPWTTAEAREIIRTVASGLGAQKFEPEVGKWNHSSCDAWNIQLRRAHLGIDRATMLANQETAVAATKEKIRELLRQKHDQTKRALESLTVFGAETPAEGAQKERLLYDFWALGRALEATK